MQRSIGTRVLFIGSASVGKTCLIKRLVEEAFEQNTIATTGSLFFLYVTGNRRHPEIQLWDTAGMERYRAINTLFYQQAAAAILVFDVTNETSFTELDSWLSEFHANSSPNCPVGVAGNKCDAIDPGAMDVEPAKRFTELHHLPFFLTSALTGQNVKEMIEKLVEMIPVKESRVDTVPIPEKPEPESQCHC
jgi:small GTP-binding protein